MQYSFVYQALLEYYLYGDTELDVSSLEGHLQKLHNTFADGDRVGLEEEFKVQSLKIRLHTSNHFIIILFTLTYLHRTNSLFHFFYLLVQKLTNMRIMKENMRTGNLPANMKKNRVLQIIPCKKEESLSDTSFTTEQVFSSYPALFHFQMTSTESFSP